MFARMRDLLVGELALYRLMLGGGLDSRTVRRIKRLLRELTLGRSLEESRPPLSIIATDLPAGRSEVLRRGVSSAAAQ